MVDISQDTADAVLATARAAIAAAIRQRNSARTDERSCAVHAATPFMRASSSRSHAAHAAARARLPACRAESSADALDASAWSDKAAIAAADVDFISADDFFAWNLASARTATTTSSTAMVAVRAPASSGLRCSLPLL